MAQPLDPREIASLERTVKMEIIIPQALTNVLVRKWAKKISPANFVTFKTANEAQEAWYVPCKACKPPVKD